MPQCSLPALLATFAYSQLLVAAAAHDIWGVANPKLNLGDSDARTELSELAQRTADPGARYVLERGKLWAPGSSLRVCFYGGTREQRDAIYESVADLLNGKQINLTLDFGNRQSYATCNSDPTVKPHEIRVTFDSCCAAYIGRESLLPSIIADGPSVFLQGPPSKHLIQHEFMHALGVHHEHQSPAANCALNLKVDVIAKRWGWSEDKVKTNLSTLNRNSSSYAWSTLFDRSSIMKYYFLPEFLIGGQQDRCFSPENTTASQLDIEGLRTAYPASTSRDTHRVRVGTARNAIDLSSLSESARAIIVQSLDE